MGVLQSVLIIFFFLIIPFLTGYVFVKESDFQIGVIGAQAYVSGWMFLLALFQVLAIPMMFAKQSLTRTMIAWGVVVVVAAIYGGYKLVFKQSGKLICFSKKISGLGIVVIALIIFQCFVVGYFQHIDDDDAWYVTTSLTSYVTDTINIYSPTTGDLLNWHATKQYVVSPLPVFWAMISKLCMIHPTIVMHDCVPICFVGLTYIVYYLLAKHIWDNDDKKVLYFLLLMCVLNIWGFSSTRTTASMLLLRVWQGKAFMGATIIPLLFAYALDYYKNGCTTSKLCVIEFALIAMILASSMGVLVGIMCIGIYITIPCLFAKKIKQALIPIILIIPNIIMGIIYICL